MRIAICTETPENVYSGGRYLAWMMAEALASCAHRVTVWTNNMPIFAGDFSAMPCHDLLDVQCRSRFWCLPSGTFDVVVLIPGQGDRYGFYEKSLYLVQRDRARLVLLNFESANWFNELSPVSRDPALWAGWLKASGAADIILSLAAESTRYAEEFYTNAPSGVLFRHCYPAINSPVADAVHPVARERQIICITRFGARDSHKGGRELLKAIGPAMKGYTLAVMVGAGEIDRVLETALSQKASQHGVALRFLYQLSDEEKFLEIKRSALMVFLSFFEGFGYPPVEALYCDTPCVVYDLPVLREVSGDALIYVPPGDELALQAAIGQVLSGKYRPAVPLSEQIAPVARFDAYASRLDDLVGELMSLPYKPAAARAPVSVRRATRRRFFVTRVKDPYRWALMAAREVLSVTGSLLTNMLRKVLSQRAYARLRDQYRSLRSLWNPPS